MAEEIIAIFKADIEQFKSQMAELGGKIQEVDNKVAETSSSTQNFSKQTKGASASVSTLSRGLGGVAGLLGVTGRLFGVNTDKVEALIFASQQFVRVGRDLASAQRLSTTAIQANTVATKAAAAATAVASGGIALLITGIVAAASALYAWISAKKSDVEITEEQIKLQEELNEANQEGIKISNDAKIAALENQVAIIKAGGTETVAATEAVAVAEYKVLLEKLKQTQAAIDDANRVKFETQQIFDERVRRLLQNPVKATAEEKAAAELLFQQKDNELQSLLILQGQYNAQVAVLDKTLVKDVKKITDTSADERKKKLQKEYDEEIRLLDEKIKKAIALYGKDSAAFIKAQEDKNKARDDFFNKQEDLILGNAEIEASLTKTKIDDEKARFQTELNNLGKQFNLEDRQTEAFQKRKELIEKAHQKNLTDIEKEEAKKRLDEQIKNSQEVADIVFKAQQEAFDKKQALLDKEIDLQDKNIEHQRALAEKGLENTLAFEEKRSAELQRQQQLEAQKQKRVKLLETFLNALAEYSKTDPNTALSKALLQVALAQAATAVFAEEGGIIGEIGERSNLRRKHKGGGDVLLHAQKGEGIFSRDEMSNLGRRNFHLLKDAARFPIRDDVFAMPKLAMAGGMAVSNAEVVKELKALQHIVKNKKESHFEVDKFGSYIKTSIENGVTEVTKGKLKKPRF